MLSTRQPLIVSPSFSSTGFDPFRSKIARRTPGAMTMPVKRAPPRSRVLEVSVPVLGGGCRVGLNRGRARIVETNSVGSALTLLNTAGLLSSFGGTVAGGMGCVIGALSSNRIKAPKNTHPTAGRRIVRLIMVVPSSIAH
jgi:hypothetical protein